MPQRCRNPLEGVISQQGFVGLYNFQNHPTGSAAYRATVGLWDVIEANLDYTDGKQDHSMAADEFIERAETLKQLRKEFAGCTYDPEPLDKAIIKARASYSHGNNKIDTRLGAAAMQQMIGQILSEFDDERHQRSEVSCKDAMLYAPPAAPDNLEMCEISTQAIPARAHIQAGRTSKLVSGRRPSRF